MFYAYVLKSDNEEFYYKGHCQDLAIRLAEHNAGRVRSTKHYKPLHMVYFEEFLTRDEAILREKYFKTAAGRKFLKKVLIRNGT